MSQLRVSTSYAVLALSISEQFFSVFFTSEVCSGPVLVSCYRYNYPVKIYVCVVVVIVVVAVVRT